MGREITRDAGMAGKVEDSMTWLYVLLGVGVVVFVALLFCFYCWLDSLVKQWGELSARFRYRGKFKGRLYGFQHGGLMPWGSLVAPQWRSPSELGVLQVGVSEEGVYLVPMIPFRLFHRPLLIPWSEVSAERRKELCLRHTVFRLHSHPDISLVLYGEALQNAVEYLASAEDAVSAGKPGRELPPL